GGYGWHAARRLRVTSGGDAVLTLELLDVVLLVAGAPHAEARAAAELHLRVHGALGTVVGEGVGYARFDLHLEGAGLDLGRVLGRLVLVLPELASLGRPFRAPCQRDAVVVSGAVEVERQPVGAGVARVVDTHAQVLRLDLYRALGRVGIVLDHHP